jgi:TRAP-type C4-dicarboxylate transport system permease small subunit
MLKKLYRALDIAENAFAFLGCALLLVATGTVVLEVASRYFFQHSFVWVNELNEYILLYIPFLAAAWLLRQNGHITVDILDEKLSPRWRLILDILIACVGIFVSAIFVWYGTAATIDAWERDVRSLTVLKTPQVFVFVIIPAGSLLLLLEFSRKLVNAIRGKTAACN